MRARMLVGGLFCLVPGLPVAQAAQDDPVAQSWASVCFACHGPEGRSDGGMPTLAGQSADGLYRSLLDFKQGKRTATVMQHLTRGYSDQQLRRIADALGVATE